MQGDGNSVGKGFYRRITIIVQIIAKINNFEHAYANTLMHTSHSPFIKILSKSLNHVLKNVQF